MNPLGVNTFISGLSSFLFFHQGFREIVTLQAVCPLLLCVSYHGGHTAFTFYLHSSKEAQFNSSVVGTDDGLSEDLAHTVHEEGYV